METIDDWNALPTAEKAKSLAEQARQAQQDGQDQVAASLYIQSLNLYRGLEDKPNVVRVLIRLAYLSGSADFGDGLDMFARRKRLGAEAMPLAKALGDKALLSQALAAFAAGEPTDVSRKMLEESAALAEECGDKSALAWAKTRLANVSRRSGDTDRAPILNQEALALYEEVGDKSGIANVLFSMSIRAPRAEKRAA